MTHDILCLGTLSVYEPANQARANYLGLPSLSIPCGFNGKGLPIGMQLIGRSFDEATLLTIGAAFQRATDYHDRLPELP